MTVFATSSNLGKVILPKAEQDQEQTENKSSKWNQKAFIAIIFVSLTVGCFWQMQGLRVLHNSSQNVYTFELNSEDHNKPMPAITLCNNVGQDFGYNSSNPRTSHSMLKTLRAYDMVEYIRVVSDDGAPEIDVTHYINHTIDSISNKYYCFTINSALKSPRLDFKVDRQLKIKIKRNGIYGSWWLYLHSPRDMPSSYEWNAIELNMGRTIPIGYTHQAFRLLEDSSPQSCFNYNEYSEHLSRKDCIRKCKLRQSITRCDVIHNGLDVYRDEGNTRFAQTGWEKVCVSEMNGLYRNAVERICNTECPHRDCSNDVYKPYVITTWGSYEKDTAVVHLFKPTEPEPIYIERPVVETKSYHYFMFGNLSVWLGFVFYFFYNCLHSYFASNSVNKK